MTMQLDGRTVAILATDVFEYSELTGPRRLLEEAGARVDVVSLEKRPIRGWQHGEWHQTVAAAVRGSTRPAHSQIRSLILSTRRGALQNWATTAA